MVTQDLDQSSPGADAAAVDQVIKLLRQSERSAVADRIGFLQRLSEEDPEEPRLDCDSLRSLADLMLARPQLPQPGISTSPDGVLLAQWRIPPHGLMTFEFLPDGRIQFAAISAPANHPGERETVYGTLPPDETLAAVGLFTAKLERS